MVVIWSIFPQYEHRDRKSESESFPPASNLRVSHLLQAAARGADLCGDEAGFKAVVLSAEYNATGMIREKM